jgi:hypothetical protein
MQFRIGTTTYHGAALDQLSLRDILLFEQETENLGRPLKWAQVEQWTTELDRLVTIAGDETRPKAARDAAEKEYQAHPGSMWMMALMIWAGRKIAGEAITFGDAIAFPVSDLQWIPDEPNRATRRATNPTTARPTPKGSGRAGKPPLAAPQKKASKPRSTRV